MQWYDFGLPRRGPGFSSSPRHLSSNQQKQIERMRFASFGASCVVHNGIKEADLQSLSHLSCYRPQRSMKRFTNTKLEDMHLMYGLTEGNARAAARLYRERHLQRDTPTIGFLEICTTICENMDRYEVTDKVSAGRE